MAKKVKLVQVNCSNKDICNHFEVKKFPTIRSYYKKAPLQSEPGRETIDLLELIDKLTSPGMIHINSLNEAKYFSEKYGDISFILLDYSNSTNLYKCIEDLSENKFKTEFYFGFIPYEKANKSSLMDFPKLQV